MKFDYCIGNPPYQVESNSTKALSPSVYNDFMDAAYTISDKVELITPARFLFHNGNTPKEWNEKMLNDEHFKVLDYEVDSSKVFPKPVDIKGGVAITYRDNTKIIGPVGTFVSNSVLRSILTKVQSLHETSLMSEVYTSSKWDLKGLYSEHPDYRQYIKDNGNHSQMDAAAFTKVPVFYEDKPDDGCEYVQLYGRANDARTYRYVKRKYIKDSGNLFYYKVFVPKANGSGAIGEVLSTPVISTPVIGTPAIGSTQTFLAVGKFDNLAEAENLLKYLKGKFSRVMLGTLKVTQNNPPSVWANIPLQDFTSNSDIDWSKSISDIDKQLYQKYGLSDDEINFIETHVKEK